MITRLVNAIPSHVLPDAVKNESMSDFCRLCFGSSNLHCTAVHSPVVIVRATRSIPLSWVFSLWPHSDHTCTASY